MLASFLRLGSLGGNCKQGQSEITELDCSMGEKKGLSGVKLSRPSPRGEKSKMEEKQADFMSQQCGVFQLI